MASKIESNHLIRRVRKQIENENKLQLEKELIKGQSNIILLSRKV